MADTPPITIDPIIVEPTLLTNPLAITDEIATVSLDAVPRPAYLVPLELTGYGTKITRIGGDAGVQTPIGGLWGKVALHHYSKDQFWNDDMTLMGPLVQRKTALRLPPPANSPTKMILDGESYLPIIGNKYSTNNNAFLNASTEFRWRPGYPKQAVSWVDGTQTLLVWEVVSQVLIWSCSFAGLLPAGCNFGMLSEGVLSNDGRFIVLCSRWVTPQKTPGKVDFFCVVDIEAGIAGISFPGGGVGRGPMVDMVPGAGYGLPMPITTANSGDIDWCSISPLGNYVIVKYGSTKVPSVARCFDVNPSTLVCTPRLFSAGDNPLRSVTVPATDPTDAASAVVRALKGWMMNHSHGDVAISADPALTGSSVEVLVGGIRDAATSNHCSNAERNAHGRIVAQSLATGKHLHISMGTAQLGGASECEDQHTSARCYKEPSYVLHTYAYHASNKFADEMVLWQTLLNGGGVPVRCGTTRTDDQDLTGIGMDAKYLGEAHACPSPGCEKIVFASNWAKNGNPAGAPDDYKSYILEPISAAVIQESDYVIEVQSAPAPVGYVAAGDDEPPADKLRYFKKP